MNDFQKGVASALLWAASRHRGAADAIYDQAEAQGLDQSEALLLDAGDEYQLEHEYQRIAAEVFAGTFEVPNLADGWF